MTPVIERILSEQKTKVSLRNDRKFIGIELKDSYFKQACSNLASAEAAKPQLLFSETA